MACGRRLTVVVLTWLALAGAVRPGVGADGDIDLPAELRGKTFPELEKAALDLVGRQMWSEAIEEYQRLLDEAGDRLVPAAPGQQPLLHVRRFCHLRLAALPPEALRLYRNRVDAQARKWLEEGTSRRDAALLQRIVDEAFCSSFGDQALERLGDLAFERGQFDDAERWWRMLLPVDRKRPGAELDLAYPDPDVDLAQVRAKLLLSRLFRDDRQGWDEELKAFRVLHPEAEGRLAGRQGNYADILQELAGRPDELTLAARDEWLTFAGDPSRSRVLPRDPRDPNRLNRLAQFPPWRIDLEKRTRREDIPAFTPMLNPGTPPSAAARALAFHPVIVGRHVLVADARYITAIDLTNGTPATWFDLKENVRIPEPELSLPAKPGLRYTLTVADGCVFARLGAQEIKEPADKDRDPAATASFLVCLGLEPDHKGGRFRWMVQPDPAKPGTAIFEGAPVGRDGRVYIAATRFTADQVITSIHCYPAESRDSPAPRWRQDVCGKAGPRPPRTTHHLLTLAGPNVVYCSHSGAVVALDAVTGRPVWAVRYPSRGPNAPAGGPSPRDLAPCVYAVGRLFVAPADSDRLLCLDPATGQILWQRDRIEVVHLLGVGMGRLIFTTPDGIRAVYAANGRDVPGWFQPSSGRMPPFGRGCLAGELVFWPTATGFNGRPGLYILNQKDGSQPDNLTPLAPEKIPPGNLVFGDDCLVVADARELRIYAPPARHRERQEGRVRAAPFSATEHYRLALAEADAGLLTQALASCAEAERLADRDLFGQAERLRRRAKHQRHEVLLELARQAQVEKQWQKAADLLRAAAAPEFALTDRLRALARQAELWVAAGKPDQAAAVWQTILNDASLRNGQLTDRAGRPQNAAVLAAEQIDCLIQEHGRDIYRSIEARAHKVLHSATGDRRSREERVLREFPNAAITASLRSEMDRPGAAVALDPPDLSLPLRRRWEVPLAPSERLLVPDGLPPGAAGNGFLFFAHDRRLICREAATGRTCWTAALTFAPSWVGCRADVVLAAGAGGITCLRPADGRVLWTVAAPALDADASAPEPLSAFRLANGQLFCLQGERRLLTFDTGSGKLLWLRSAPAAHVHPADCFSPLYHVLTHTVVLYTPSGRQWMLDARHGGRKYEEQAYLGAPFAPRASVVLGGDRLALVSGPRHIDLLQGDGDQVVWRYEVPGDTTRTGEPPWVISDGKSLLVLVARNYGHAMQRLDPDTGKPLWPSERLLSIEPIDAGRIAVDDEAFYFVAGRVLCAHSLSNGERRWERPLQGPAGRWQVLRAGDFLLAYPVDVPADQFRFRWLGAAVELRITRPLDDPSRRSFPVMVCDARTGQVIQRLNFSPAGLGVIARAEFTANWAGMPTVSGERQTDAVPVVLLTDEGAVVALEGRAWGLRGPKRGAED
ncbi:MAG TPA: PQQ-binding-like beta-propeller repeat protein [Gemmataceae bacterium]|nr:PQQ-binding-like beta-propeller repeat protein [Gemmataceae bacterium]